MIKMARTGRYFGIALPLRDAHGPPQGLPSRLAIPMP